MIYVAAKFEEKERVRDAYALLRTAGHEITCDWTKEDDTGKTGDELDRYHAECAERDLEGVAEADALVIFPHENGKGLYVELGVALAAAIPIICVSEDGTLPNCVFLKVEDVRHVRTIDEAIRVLGRGKIALHRRAS